MLVRLVLWDLDGAPVTIEELRIYLRDESVDAFAQVEGLRFKAWISQPSRNRWGAVYLWESEEASRQRLPSRAGELIGKPPDLEEMFEVEATTEGRSAIGALARLGLAFDDE